MYQFPILNFIVVEDFLQIWKKIFFYNMSKPSKEMLKCKWMTLINCTSITWPVILTFLWFTSYLYINYLKEYMSYEFFLSIVDFVLSDHRCKAWQCNLQVIWLWLCYWKTGPIIPFWLGCHEDKWDNICKYHSTVTHSRHLTHPLFYFPFYW